MRRLSAADQDYLLNGSLYGDLHSALLCDAQGARRRRVPTTEGSELAREVRQLGHNASSFGFREANRLGLPIFLKEIETPSFELGQLCMHQCLHMR